MFILASEDEDLWVHRSTDSGSSWRDPLWIASSPELVYWGSWASIAAFDDDVGLVWVQEGHLCFAYSTNSAASFGAPVSLAGPSLNWASAPRIALGPNGSVGVLWESTDQGPQVRVSSNGGSSFGAASSVAEGDGRGAAIAIGDDVVYVLYLEGEDLLVRRSFDMGESWTSPQPLDDVVYAAEDLDNPAAMVADGSAAYIAYVVEPGYHKAYIRYRQTFDSGRSWSRAVNLSPGRDAPMWSTEPVLTQGDGTIHVAYSRCNTWFRGRCDLASNWSNDVVYTRSRDGASWTPAETAFAEYDGESPPIGVAAFTDRVLVLFAPSVVVTRSP